MTLKTWALSCSAALLASMATSGTWAQDVDVQAGDTSVQVDRSGVQADAQRDQQARQANPQRPGARGNMDNQIAQWLIIDQRNIVNLAQYGLQKTQSPQVRELAETIARDHEAFMRKLSNVGARVPTESPAGEATTVPREERERERATGDNRRDAGRERDGNRGRLENLGERLEEGVERLSETAGRVAEETREGLDRVVDGDRPNRVLRGNRWVDIHREIIQEIEDVARQDLQKRQGYEFEAAFVGMLVASHLQQEATLGVLSNHASDELAQTLKEALASVKQHREQAEQVMGQIKR